MESNTNNTMESNTNNTRFFKTPKFQLSLRGVQAVFAIIVLGLAGYGMVHHCDDRWNLLTLTYSGALVVRLLELLEPKRDQLPHLLRGLDTSRDRLPDLCRPET